MYPARNGVRAADKHEATVGCHVREDSSYRSTSFRGLGHRREVIRTTSFDVPTVKNGFRESLLSEPCLVPYARSGRSAARAAITFLAVLNGVPVSPASFSRRRPAVKRGGAGRFKL